MLAYSGWLVHKDQSLPDTRSRINTLLRALGFVLTLVTSCGLATLHWSGAGLPNSAGGVLGELVGQRQCPGFEFSRRDAAVAGVVAGRRGVVPRRVVVSGHGQARRLGVERDRMGPQPDGAAARTRLRSAAQAGAPGSGARRAEESGQPAAAANRGAGAPAAKERSRRTRAPGAAVRRAEVERIAGVVAARRARRARAVLLRRGVGGDVAPGGNQAARFRHRGRGRGGAAGPGDHALRVAARTRRQGQPDQQSCQGSGARAVGDQRARGRSHSRQIGGGFGNTQREARDRDLGRNHQIQALR